MNLGVTLTVFILILLAELPDKTMIAMLIMGSRYRPVTVWIGVTLAFAIHVTVAAVGFLTTLACRRPTSLSVLEAALTPSKQRWS